jgi:hypothetical protein
VMRDDYQKLLMDRDYLLEVGEMYHRELKEEIGVDQITHELASTWGFLEGTQITLQKSGSILEECQMMEVCEGYDQEMMEDAQVSQGPPFMGSSETVGHTHTHGDSRAGGSYEDTSICVPGLANIHVEVDPTIHLGYVMR